MDDALGPIITTVMFTAAGMLTNLAEERVGKKQKTLEEMERAADEALYRADPQFYQSLKGEH